MGQATIDIDDLSEYLTLAEETGDWPSIEINVVYDIHPSEPDVGIFGEQLEIIRLEYVLDGTTYKSEAAFVSALYERISGDIDDDEEAVRQAIRKIEQEWERNFEPGDDYDELGWND